MERRALIAGLICLAILLLYQELIIKRFYPPPSEPTGTAEERTLQPPAAPPPAAPATTEAESPTAAAPPPIAGKDVVIDTDLYHAVFTTAGARLKSFQLKRFRTTVDPNSPPLDLMSQAVESDRPLGIELRGRSRGGEGKDVVIVNDGTVPYRVDREALALRGDDSGTVTFAGDLRGGGRLTKVIRATGDSYLFDMSVHAEGVPGELTEVSVGWNKELEDPRAHGGEILFNADVMLQNGKLHRELFTALKEPLLFEGNIAWTAYEGRYFLAAMVPAGDGVNDLRVWLKRREAMLENKLYMPPNQFDFTLGAFVGPKDIDVLGRAGHSLGKAVDLGFWAPIAQPLFQALQFLYRFTGNYGVSIILLTVAIKILFIPLTQRSLKSMREMQKLQPQMQQIRERYKDKPDEMNKEIMELYRRHKVNPLGGCLPMVLQIPVFIGLYNALSNAVELRHAPFIGWINDLSAPDRLGTMQLPFVERPGFPVLTLLMGGTMFLQQWMSPSQADPTQQRVMLIMPLMFTVMFINFPSGLTLYWLVNNILTIAQQYWINRSRD